MPSTQPTMKPSKTNDIIRKKLKDMTPTKRERFMKNVQTLIKQGQHARYLREGI